MPSMEKITREKIIRAFLEASFRKSEGATSLSDISEILGIKKASLYNHYENRDAIVEDTIRWCGEYLRKASFIPPNMTTTAEKYPAETVLKGLVNRWVKMHEKDPLLKIYSFVESEKYYSTEAMKIAEESREKLCSQVEIAVKSLADAKKIAVSSEKEIAFSSKLFALSFRDLLDAFIVEKKEIIRKNPETGDGSLFANLLQSGESSVDFDSLVENFVDNFRNA